MAIDRNSAELHWMVADAIRLVRTAIRWKPNKARPHLHKRIRLQHLPVEASLADYEAIIREVVSSSGADVYVFRFGEHLYPTVVAPFSNRLWLVMVNPSGVLETAFPVDKPAEYLVEETGYFCWGSWRSF